MVAAQWIVLAGLVIIALSEAVVFFGRRGRAVYEIGNEDGLLEELHDDLVAEEFVAAYMHAFRTGTPISRVVAAGLERFESGKDAVFSAMRGAIEVELTRWHGALLGLSVCGTLASALGVVGLIIGLPNAISGTNLIDLISTTGILVVLAVIIAVMAFVGHGALLKMMDRSRRWLDATGTEILNEAARTVVLSTKMSSVSLREPRPVAVGRKS